MPAPHFGRLAEGDPPELEAALAAARRCLLDRQQPDGHWCGELQGDSILQSEYILLMAWLDRLDDPDVQGAARYLLRQQRAAGGWAQYPGGPVDISASVKAYFALKLTGQDPNSEAMQRARAAVLAHGGADAVNSFTRFYLALLGQIGYEHCPAVPPEAVLLPHWLPMNMYRVSAWSRTIFVPLAIMWAHRPVRAVPPQLGIQELFHQAPDQWPALRCPGLPASNRWWRWDRFFRGVDATLKYCERWNLKPLRRRALRAAERWMLERFEDSDGLGAIFPPIVWSIVALKCLGHDDLSPPVRYCLEQLRGLMIREGNTVRLQPCKSPVWDTALSLRAVAASDGQLDDSAHPIAVARSVDWLLSKEVRQRGDWSVNVRAEPAGWFFEYQNAFYPDVDDTIMVMMALRESALQPQSEPRPDFHSEFRPTRERLPEHFSRQPAELTHCRPLIEEACERARRWILAMQNRDGGWGAFDKDNDYEFLCHVPFADHNAMIDPSTPDITARVLEALGQCGTTVGCPAVDRAVRYLRETQESDGAWPGRWGVNYLYGTWQVLVGMVAAGVARSDPAVVRGAQWLLRHQLPSGGWGESAATYEDPTLRGQGPATPSQTAWAVLGLLATGHADHPATVRGVRWLIEHQQADGSWSEPEFTGTGFPRVFYLRYHLYPLYFPLLALGQYARRQEASDGRTTGTDVGRVELCAEQTSAG